MKRLTLLSLWFCSVYFCLSAQHLNLAWQPEFFNTPYRIEPFTDGWVVASELLDAKYHPKGPYITKIGPQGMRWGRRWMEGNPNALSAFAVLPGSRVMVSGWQGGCDTSGDRFFIIYDDDGEEIYIKYEDADRDSFVWIPYVSELRSLPGGGYLGSNNFQVLTLNDTLGYRDHIGVNWPDEYLKFLAQTNDSTFWAGFRNYRDGYWQVLPFITRGYNLRRENGWAPFDLALGDTLLDLKTYDGSVYALAGDAIWENRPPYQSPVAHPLPPSGRDYFKLHRISDAFLLLGTDGQGRANILRLDMAFNYVSQWTYESGIFKPVDFAVRADTLAVLGQLVIPAAERFLSDRYQDAPAEANTLLAVKTFGANGSTQAPRADMEITGMAWSGESELLPSYCILDECGELYRVRLKGFSISVRNNSPFIINSLVLNTRRPYCFNCFWICEFHQAYWQRYEGLRLLPGQEITLPFDQAMEFRNQYFDSGFELCFWVSDADGHLEKVYDNNLYCQVLPLESAGMPEDSWNIHPNPVREELWIGFSPATSMAGKLRVYNAVGQQVLLSPLPAQSLSYRLPVDRLAAGLYLLEWENGEERLVKRFVKR